MTDLTTITSQTYLVTYDARAGLFSVIESSESLVGVNLSIEDIIAWIKQDMDDLHFVNPLVPVHVELDISVADSNSQALETYASQVNDRHAMLTS